MAPVAIMIIMVMMMIPEIGGIIYTDDGRRDYLFHIALTDQNSIFPPKMRLLDAQRTIFNFET